MNIRFTFSAMGATGGGGDGEGNQRAGWGFVDNNADMGYMRVCGLTFHSVPLHKKNYHINWTYDPNHEDGIRPNTPAGAAFHDVAARWAAALDRNNPLRQTFRQLSEQIQGDHVNNIGIVFTGYAGTQHGAPLVGEVASLSATPDGPAHTGYNIIAFHRREDGEWRNHRIWPGDPLFMELQYPLLFPRGKGGWWRGYTTMQGDKISLADYMRHATYQFDHLRKSAALAQQFTLDMHATVQWERLVYHEKQLPKKRLVRRREVGRAAAEGGGAVPAADAGVPFHSASFTGSPAYYSLHRKKALVLLARMGKPSYFVTFTCNAKWPEIEAALPPGDTWCQHPDIVNRVFHEKKRELLEDIKKGWVFVDSAGRRQCSVSIMWAVEYQKRGLPHVHIAVRMEGEEVTTAGIIDRNVSAILPVCEIHPQGPPDGPLPQCCADARWLNLFVQGSMTHSCTAACKGRGNVRCSKHFPKPTSLQTAIDDKGFTILMRDGRSIFVVPFNKKLLQKYHAHINVEVAGSVNCAGYLFKYILKGTDTAAIQVVQRQRQQQHQQQQQQARGNEQVGDLRNFLSVK
jgi:hypothetical protein